MEELEKGMKIDGCAGTSGIDSQGEQLSIEGCDISTLEQSMGRFNDNHTKTFMGQVGRVTSAKKIFKAEDCDTDRQKMYWNQVKVPFIYVSGELYDDTEHPNAKATAAIMKHLAKGNSPLSVKMSVEGAVLARKDGGILDRTKVHSVALTFTPANKQTLALPMDDLTKSILPDIDWEILSKSITILPYAPAFIEVDMIESKIVEAAGKVLEIVQKVTALKKAISAGYPGGGEPMGLTGGGVLAMPSIDKLYTSCSDCGKRQIVKRKQTSCSHCGKGFTMEKIAKMHLD